MLATSHYELAGLLQSWLNKNHGLGYYSFRKMGLPVYSGVEEALKMTNTRRMKVQKQN